jgi:hypothetical protein
MSGTLLTAARRGRRATGVVLAAALGAFALAAARYHPFFADDAFISLRYATRLAAGQGLTWNDGERVEGYSNLAWVLACALLARLGLDPVFAARLLGVLGVALAIGAVVRAHAPTAGRSALPALAGGLVVALAAPSGAWAVGGLEPPLLMALVAWGTVLCLPLVDADPRPRDALLPGLLLGDADPRPRDALLPGLLLGVAALTRPDGILFAAAAAAAIAVAGRLRRAPLAAAATLAGVAALCWLGQLGFRLAYHGDWVPNTAHAKLAFTPHRLREGLAYVGEQAAWMAPLLLPLSYGAVTLLRDAATRPRALLLVIPVGVWLAYVAVVGGDIFPAARHFAPVVPLFALLAAEVLAVRRPASRWAWLGAGAVLAAFGVAQVEAPASVRAAKECWEWDAAAAGTFLGRVFGPARPLLAVDMAGAVPYFSGLPTVDLLGLNDRFLATHPPADLGQGRIGHELGDGAYVLGRRPDLVYLCSPAGARRGCFRSGKELVALPAFAEQYRFIAFLSVGRDAFRSDLWVRLEDGRIGLTRAGGRVAIPGYLFASALADRRAPQAVATLDEEGAFGARLGKDQPGRLREIALRPGRVRVEVEGSGAAVTVRLSAGAASAEARPGETLVVPGDRVDVTVTSEGPAHLRRLTLVAVD